MTEEINNDDLNGFDIINDSAPIDIGEAPASLRRRGGRKPYKLVLAGDITVANTAKTFLIDGFLGSGEVSIWFGPPECGKSTALIDAACHVAAGMSWCGRDVSPGPVLYVAAERGQVVQRRILAWRLEHRIDDFPLAVIDDAVDLRTGKVDTDRIIEAANKLKAMCGKPVVWIVFDTLSRVLAGGDENSSKDMGMLVLSVDHIKRSTEAHCSLVHHVPHGSSARMRGHGAVSGAADLTVMFEKQNGIVNLMVDKASDLAEDEKPKHCFRFKSITLTEEPPRRTASVMIPVVDQAPAPTMKPEKRRDTKPVRTFRDAFTEALDDHGEIIRVRGDGPKVKAVEVKLVREQFEVRYVTGETDEKKRAAAASRAFRRTIADLPPDFGHETRDGRELIWKVSKDMER
jgi:AAA domain